MRRRVVAPPLINAPRLWHYYANPSGFGDNGQYLVTNHIDKNMLLRFDGVREDFTFSHPEEYCQMLVRMGHWREMPDIYEGYYLEYRPL